MEDEIMSKEKIVLAYSGGLDTSVAIAWLKNKGYDVIACCIDVGEGKDLEAIKEKGLQVGAWKSVVIDAKRDFAEQFVLPALQAHAMYEQKYPLVSALSRPLIVQKLVAVANQYGATAIAHGCTGKGNDQVRFETGIHALAPDMKIEDPIRDWHWSREEEIQYAKDNGIPVPITKASPYSIDENLWAGQMNVEFLKIRGLQHLLMHMIGQFQLKKPLIPQLQLKLPLMKEFLQQLMVKKCRLTS